MMRDHHEGYIESDRFVVDRHRLGANRTDGDSFPGPAGKAFAGCKACCFSGCAVAD